MWLQRSAGLAVKPASRGPSTCHRPALRIRAFIAESNGGPQAAPTAAELVRDSRLAALSGLAYLPSGELAGRLQQHGLELQASGTTHFTRWFVARQSSAAAAALGAGAAASVGREQASAAGALSLAAAEPQQQYVFFRGVSWRSADLDALRVWQGLMRALPSPFLPHLTAPPELLQAHSGVAEMAEELFQVLRPHMEGQPHLHLAGHSLGGSLATLVALTAHLRLGGGGGGNNGSSGGGGGGRQGQQQPQAGTAADAAGVGMRVRCTTFGSPPVLAMSQGGEDGRSILRAVRLPPGAFRNYVLQDDPVPRALLSADPAFMALKQTPAVAGLLRLREQWLGQGALSPTRFLFHPAGDVYLVRWSQEGGHYVRLLEPDSLQEELKLDVETLRSSPMALMQAVLDHHHASYSSEIRAAAAAMVRRESARAAASALADPPPPPADFPGGGGAFGAASA